MRAELRSLHAPEADGGELNAFQPDDAEDFGVFVQAFVGPAGESGEESFGFTVCTAPWLARQDLPKGFAFERGILRLERW